MSFPCICTLVSFAWHLTLPVACYRLRRRSSLSKRDTGASTKRSCSSIIIRSRFSAIQRGIGYNFTCSLTLGEDFAVLRRALVGFGARLEKLPFEIDISGSLEIFRSEISRWKRVKIHLNRQWEYRRSESQEWTIFREHRLQKDVLRTFERNRTSFKRL